MSILDFVFCVMAFATCLRLLIYRRSGAKFKASYSILAYLLIVTYGSLGIALLTGIYQALYFPLWLWLAQVMTTIATFICRGNVSRLIKLTGRLPHVINLR